MFQVAPRFGGRTLIREKLPWQMPIGGIRVAGMRDGAARSLFYHSGTAQGPTRVPHARPRPVGRSYTDPPFTEQALRPPEGTTGKECGEVDSDRTRGRTNHRCRAALR